MAITGQDFNKEALSNVKIQNLLNQIKSLLLSHHHSTSALVSEILMSVLQTVQKNKTKKTTIYIWTVQGFKCWLQNNVDMLQWF